MAKFNADGQANANAYGTCTFSSIAYSGTFTRNDCAAGGVGSGVPYSQAAGVMTSAISQADADSKGLAKFNADGQTNANTYGSCTFSSIAYSGTFTRYDCAAGGVGSGVPYSQAAGASTSMVSQADADLKGLAKFGADGQANANAYGTCTFSSIAKSGAFTRNNCAVGGVGSTVVYTVPAGRYNSTASQAAADALAQDDVNNNGQAYANANGYCTFSSIAKSGSFTRNNCDAGGFASTVVYTVPAGRYNSTASQAAADGLAQDDVNNNGQAYANANGICTYYNAAVSKTFIRNNCPANSDPGSYTYIIGYGEYSSTISQGHADQLALNALNATGQNWTNTQATCTFYSVSRSGTFRKNCGSGYTGSTVSYTSPMGAAISTVSQADADAKGLIVFNTNGQAAANAGGTCTADFPYHFEYSYNAAINRLYIDLWADTTNHPAITLDFDINYITKTGAAAITTERIVFPAGQADDQYTILLSASSIVSIRMSIPAQK